MNRIICIVCMQSYRLDEVEGKELIEGVCSQKCQDRLMNVTKGDEI